MDFIYLAIGFVVLVLGGEALVRGAVGLARRLGLSPLLIGLTVVAWGTSSPELVVSVKAGLDGSGGIAIGNVIGSNIFNILAIMGLVASLRTLAVRRSAIQRDAAAAVLSGFAVVALIAGGTLTPLHGGLLLSALAIYNIVTYRQERRSVADPLSPAVEGEAAIRAETQQSVPFGLMLIAIGLGLLVVGADLMVDAAVSIARGFGLPEAVIGLTIVAAGTSLPEVATSVVAAFRREADVAIGNVLGSCTFNSLGILGVTSLFGPIAVPPDISTFDAVVAAIVPVLLLVPAAVLGRIGRISGLAMLGLYGGYVLLLAHRIGAL